MVWWQTGQLPQVVGEPMALSMVQADAESEHQQAAETATRSDKEMQHPINAIDTHKRGRLVEAPSLFTTNSIKAASTNSFF